MTPFEKTRFGLRYFFMVPTMMRYKNLPITLTSRVTKIKSPRGAATHRRQCRHVGAGAGDVAGVSDAEQHRLCRGRLVGFCDGHRGSVPAARRLVEAENPCDFGEGGKQSRRWRAVRQRDVRAGGDGGFLRRRPYDHFQDAGGEGLRIKKSAFSTTIARRFRPSCQFHWASKRFSRRRRTRSICRCASRSGWTISRHRPAGGGDVRRGIGTLPGRHHRHDGPVADPLTSSGRA